jgi:hypothetical protein
MKLSPQNLRRIALLPKGIIAEVLSLIADIVADFEAQSEVKVEPQKPHVEAQNRKFEAQKPQNGQFEGECFSSLLTSLPTSNSREEGSKENKALSRKASTRKLCPREGFDEFWQAYPKRINKQDAVRKFDIALKSGVEKTLIIEAAKRYATATSTTEKRYIKAPDVWLHKGCYDDEELPQARAVPSNGRSNGTQGFVESVLLDIENDKRRREESSTEAVPMLQFGRNGN